MDDGSTVTDFLPAERARGITIQSAAITFHWPPLPPANGTPRPATAPVASRSSQLSHTINLIDTPGHADFTFEVLRSLRVLDGAICILDGVAGVEAQTEKVWNQAATYYIPKIIYINKLDRDGAAFGKTVKEIAMKLHAWPAICQIPWFEKGVGRFMGIVDVVNLRALQWADGGDGKNVEIVDLATLAVDEPALGREGKRARIALVELLSEHDDLMVEKYLECNEDHMAILPADIISSLRRCVLDGVNVVPVFAGASFRNIGVQPVLDAVVALLPNPDECPDPEIRIENTSGGLRDLLNGKLVIEQPKKELRARKGRLSNPFLTTSLESCALAFKVVNDAKRGVLVYVRVYHGNINRNALVYNTNLQISERVPRLLQMFASDAVEVGSISAGQIGVLVGLKHARTGDTLVSCSGGNPKNGPPAPLNSLQLRPIEVPPPVFFASIEPQSLSEQKHVTEALALLLREDPSLHLSVDEESGQTLLSGMGELHLEIARDRLIQDLKAKALMGSIEIGYRESITVSAGPEHVTFEREIAGKHGKAGCAATVSPMSDTDVPNNGCNALLQQDGNLIKTQILGQDLETLDPELADGLLLPYLTLQSAHTALQNGALAALARGPQYSFAMHNTEVYLSLDPACHLFGTDSTPAAISSAARLATQAALKKASETAPTALMEPVMNVIISVDEASLGSVVQDLSSSRGGHIVSLDDTDDISAGRSGEELQPIDVRRVYAPPDPFDAPLTSGDEFDVRNSGGSRQRSITARVPLKEMIGYLKHLRSLTGGRGTFVMSVDCFEKMGSQRERAVVKEMRGV